MKIEVIMPKMGESLQEGTIIKWLKNEGERVERDEMILEISTDKVDTEVPAPQSGVIVSILAQENETIEVGKVIAIIDTEAAVGDLAPVVATAKTEAPIANVVAPVQSPEVQTPVVSAPAGSGSIVDVIMPKMGESLQEGTITKWLKKVGETVERDEMILEISTDKVDTEVPSPVAGTIVEILFGETETVEVGKAIAKIATQGGVGVATAPVTASAPEPVKSVASASATASVVVSAPVVGQTFDIPARKGDKFFSPLVREISLQNKVSLEELENLKGSGADSRITKDDLLKYIAGRGNAPVQVQAVAAPVASAASVPTQSVAAAPKPANTVAPVAVHAAPAISGDVEIIPMDRVRQKISDHMVYSKQTSAHVTSVGEADLTDIVKFRNKYKDEFFKREGIKLTFTPFFALAAIQAIKKFPGVNVSVDGKNILRHLKINLSVATALNDGNLIVPVIKNADALNITGLQRSINDLATRARTKKLNPDDIQGGTFTITNVGTFGTLFGTPIINQPQTGIMGIGAIQKRPVVREFNGEDLIVVRNMAYVSITYDHRVIDGMLAGQWLAEVVRSLESFNENTISI